MGRKAIGILVGVGLLAVGLVAPAYGASDVVAPGESIQEAIEAARPGDTVVVRPGTYAENLEIRKEGLELLGSGATLTVPDAPRTTACSFGQEGFVVGVCVTGEFNEETFQAGELLADVKVEGFTIQGFAMGIFAVATRNLELSHNTFMDNAEYGAFALLSTRSRFLYNFARNDGFAGYYIGDSPDADATVLGNSAQGHDLGLFFRSARGAQVVDNVFSLNCAGVLVDSDPEPAGDLTLARNQIFDNDRFCGPQGHEDHEGREEEYEQEPNEQQEPGEQQEPDEQQQEEEPTISGVGILLAGARNVVVRRNNVWGNEPSGQADFAGGIVVISHPFTGAAPRDILVTTNRSFDNLPADLVWDGTGTGIRFRGNHCGSSRPEGLCG